MNLSKIKFVLTLVVVLFFCSCAVQDDEHKSEPPYYEFNPEDYPFLLDHYSSTEHLIFKNQNNEELSFNLENFEQWKEDYSLGNWTGYGSPYPPAFYYDNRKIEYEFEQYNEAYANLTFHFNKSRDTLRGSVQFPLWNENQFFHNSVLIPLNGNIFQMTIDGVTYNHVTEINSGVTTAEYTVGSYSRNVNILYYDLYKGLIGFDDLDGGEWRIFNTD